MSDQAPTVVLSAPLNADRYDAPADIVLQASASDYVGVTRVDFYGNGTLLGSDFSAPFEFLWTRVPAGLHQAVAVATDTDGVQTSSTPVNLGVKPLPGPFNFARNQGTFASSSLDGAHGPANATDRNESTGWTSAAGDGQWMYVDLGANVAFDRVTVKWSAAYATSYSIQSSQNPSFGSWSTLFVNTAGDGGVDDLSRPGVSHTRYLRVVCTQTVASNGCGIDEFEVYRDTNPTPQPFITALISPMDGSEGNRTDPVLDWSASFALYIDLYFGTTNPPALFAGNLETTSNHRMWNLATNTTYFWQVVTRNDTGSTPGPVWSFKTGSVANPAPPGTPANPSPANGATGVSPNATLSWTSTTATSYDVSFGTTSPRQISFQTTAASVTPALIYNTTYFWQVTAHNVSSDTTGPVWSFTTMTPPPVGGAPVVWTNANTRENVVWMMRDGGVAVAATSSPMESGRWFARAFIDLDGDRQPDLVWRDQFDGQNVAGLMSETMVWATAVLPTIADLNWDIRGSGDLDADGRGDLIWRNKATGQNLFWLMNGATLRAAAMMPTISDLNWEIKGVGDLDGDGRADVIWRNKATGQNLAWLMDGATIVMAAFLPTIADMNWDLKAVGDLDGDGRADLVWRNKATGQNVAWEMRGTTVSASAFLPTVADTWWDIAAIVDADPDGKVDLIWRRYPFGEATVWRMDGFSVVSSASLPSMDQSWMAAPRR